jgi:uncharacterized repeat protein (TIGR02543 family)
MRTILSLRRYYYLKRFGIFLIVIALIAGIVSCTGEPVQYDLMIDSTAGGEVTAPGEGTYTYDVKTVVDLVATPECGYAFDKWTGDTGTIDNVNAAATNITMNGDYSITANFEPLPLDHFRCYWTEDAPYVGADVQLEGQFGAVNAMVGEAVLFGNPVEKVHDDVTTPISEPNNHLTFYYLDYEGEPQWWQVTVKNQFGDQQVLVVSGPLMLGVPTQKEGHEEPECLDHFLVYHVENIVDIEASVDMTDQFGPEQQGVNVYSPAFFANPVKKTYKGEVTDIVNSEEHLVFYWTDSTYVGTQVQVGNQFGEQQVLNVDNSELLAVPSEKIDWGPLE